MAPEHRRNNPYFSSENNRYSPSSDLYSLGLVAIEALIGEYPSDILGTYKVNWSNYRVSLDLAAILDRMVHCLVRERYQSAQEVLEHLEPLSIVYRRYKIKRVLG
jgi:serine/threonine-protein kinase